jgi:hypothetical protein
MWMRWTLRCKLTPIFFYRFLSSKDTSSIESQNSVSALHWMSEASGEHFTHPSSSIPETHVESFMRSSLGSWNTSWPLSKTWTCPRAKEKLRLRAPKAFGQRQVERISASEIVQNSALKMRLQNTVPLLNDHHRTPKVENKRNEPDEDLEAIQPSATVKGEDRLIPLWKSYSDWLRLVLAHFDAVEILVGYVTGPHFA